MMRKGWVLLALALSGLGCLSPGTHVEKESQQTPPVRMADVPPPPLVVTADQVTEENAPDAAQALAKEMDYDAAPQSAVPVMAVPAANTMKP